MSMIGVKGARVAVDEWMWSYDPATIERDTIAFPEVFIEDSSVLTEPGNIDALAASLRSIFDAVWNASGFPKSPNFDNQGKWNPRH